MRCSQCPEDDTAVCPHCGRNRIIIEPLPTTGFSWVQDTMERIHGEIRRAFYLDQPLGETPKRRRNRNTR